jgi:hypothetical protein
LGRRMRYDEPKSMFGGFFEEFGTQEPDIALVL